MTDKVHPMVVEIGEEPTLNRLLDRDPHACPYSEEELRQIVAVDRRDRARWNVKMETKAMKKAGVEEPEGGPNGNSE